MGKKWSKMVKKSIFQNRSEIGLRWLDIGLGASRRSKSTQKGSTATVLPGQNMLKMTQNTPKIPPKTATIHQNRPFDAVLWNFWPLAKKFELPQRVEPLCTHPEYPTPPFSPLFRQNTVTSTQNPGGRGGTMGQNGSKMVGNSNFPNRSRIGLRWLEISFGASGGFSGPCRDPCMLAIAPNLM